MTRPRKLTILPNGEAFWASCTCGWMHTLWDADQAAAQAAIARIAEEHRRQCHR
jgi:hypothetical protein